MAIMHEKFASDWRIPLGDNGFIALSDQAISTSFRRVRGEVRRDVHLFEWPLEPTGATGCR
jgi:hypothetical protein